MFIYQNEKNWTRSITIKTVSRDIAIDNLEFEKDFDIQLIAAELLDSVYTDESVFTLSRFFSSWTNKECTKNYLLLT